MKPYKAEFFKRDFTLRAAAGIQSPELVFDYLTTEKTEITLPGAVKIARGDWAHVTDMNGAVIYQGVVMDTETDKTTTVNVAPLMSIFDVTTEIDRANIGKDLEQFIADTIRAAFVENADDYQNVQGLRVQACTHTNGAALNIKSDVHDLMDIIVRALTVYNVAVTVELRPQEKVIAAAVAKVSSAGRVIEADLPNVIEKNVYLMDTYGSLNKATYINKDDPAQRAVYYLDGETGEPTETPKSRITPVFFKVEYIEGAEDFALEAEQRAREDLTPEDFDNLIEITVHDGDKLIPPEKIRIGEIVTIKANGQSWQSVLTGYEKTQNTHKFVFGYVRVDLDKILRIERMARA